MSYVDLDPLRASIAPGLNRSKYTTVQARHRAVLKRPDLDHQPLLAMIGANSFNAPLLTNLVNAFGSVSLIQPRSPGEIIRLVKLGLDPGHWSANVKCIGNGYWCVVAEVQVEDFIDLAAQFNQRTLYGFGFAHKLVGI